MALSRLAMASRCGCTWDALGPARIRSSSCQSADNITQVACDLMLSGECHSMCPPSMGIPQLGAYPWLSVQHL